MLSELIVGRYRVEKELGRGGMGVVLRAYDTWLRRVVALKLLPPDTSHNPELSRRLAAEARAASALNHPGIATVYDFVEQNDASFVVYEYVEGQTFRDKLAQGRFTTEEVLSAGMQLSDALLAAHTRGIIHRDLKPENIMWTPDDCFGGRVKILDFGLAKCNPWPLSAGEENAPETVSIGTIPGLVIGTMNYMAPEQLEGLAADARSDIYALGLVLYEMATGANPFLGRTRASTIANILKQEAPSVRQQNPAAPADLDRILLKCLRKLPQERYHSAAELLIDFRNVEQHRSAALVNDRPGEVEPSLFGRFFLLFGATPYRRWEIMHLRMCLWSLFLVYLGWRFRVWTPNKWGFTLFSIELGCIAVLLVLICLPLYTGMFDPANLPVVVPRMAPWIRWFALALVLVTWLMAAMLAQSHSALAAFLAFCGASGGAAVLVFKPAIDRGVVARVSRERSDRKA